MTYEVVRIIRTLISPALARFPLLLTPVVLVLLRLRCRATLLDHQSVLASRPSDRLELMRMMLDGQVPLSTGTVAHYRAILNASGTASVVIGILLIFLVIAHNHNMPIRLVLLIVHIVLLSTLRDRHSGPVDTGTRNPLDRRHIITLEGPPLQFTTNTTGDAMTLDTMQEIPGSMTVSACMIIDTSHAATLVRLNYLVVIFHIIWLVILQESQRVHALCQHRNLKRGVDVLIKTRRWNQLWLLARISL
jgi:hypothetical protein